MTRSRFFKKMAKSDNAGFTLIEAMIGLFVFAVGTLAVISLMKYSIQANAIAMHDTEASVAAASVIENLRPLDYLKDAELAEGDIQLPDQSQYSLNYTVQRNAIIKNTMLIQMTVSWMEGGQQKSVNLVYIKPDII